MRYLEDNKRETIDEIEEKKRMQDYFEAVVSKLINCHKAAQILSSRVLVNNRDGSIRKMVDEAATHFNMIPVESQIVRKILASTNKPMKTFKKFRNIKNDNMILGLKNFEESSSHEFNDFAQFIGVYLVDRKKEYIRRLTDKKIL